MDSLRRLGLIIFGLCLCGGMLAYRAVAQEPGPAVVAEGTTPAPPNQPKQKPPVKVSIRQMFEDGGAIGYVIVALSVVMLALIFEQILAIRRGVMMPAGLAEEVHAHLTQGNIKAAEDVCRAKPSFLAAMLSAGLGEIGIGYSNVEKAMEDAALQQSARLLRKIEYLALISTVAPMLGLMGTVWGMILAFMEFERKANPTVSELAPGVYKALVTTLFGLIVAIPAISAFAYFRNRIDELVAQTSLLAEHVFVDYKRNLILQKRADRQKPREPQS